MLGSVAGVVDAPMRRSGARVGRRLGLVLVLVLGALGASGAWAATVSSRAVTSTITYQSAATDTDCLQISFLSGPDRYRFERTCGPPPAIVALLGCSQVSLAAVECADNVTAVTVNLGAGNDFASAAGATFPDPVTLNGGTGSDTLTLDDSGLGTANGDADGDSITGGTGADTINGGADNDSISGLAGADTINGGAGADNLYGGDDADTINGGDDQDFIYGEAGDDSLHGDAGDDNLYGQDGNETFVPEAGNDFFLGENGFDTMDYSANSASQPIAVYQDYSGNDDDGQGTVDNVYNDIEAIDGGAGNDVIDSFYAFQPVSLSGNAGNDTLTGPNITGGGTIDDTIDGGAGNDRLRGRGGADSLVGGTGIDRALYDDHSQGVTVSLDGVQDDGNATEDGALDNVDTTVESVQGSGSDDTLTGSCANNTLAPLDGDDVVNGDPGTCAVFGNDFMGGYDGYGGFNGNDTFNGQGGTDAVTYTQNSLGQPVFVSLDGAANDSDGTSAGAENVNSDIETVYGSGGSDVINASDAAQGVSLFGRDGDDILFGSAFADFIDGQAGADSLNCQDGNDMYRQDSDDLDTANCETLVP